MVGIARRRIDPIAVLSATTAMLALAAYAITGGDPLAIKPRRGAVTGTIGIVGLASVALDRPLLLLVAENVAKMNPDRPEMAARLAQHPESCARADIDHLLKDSEGPETRDHG